MSRFQVRRANVDDLPHLRELWEMEGLPAEELEQRLSESQVAHTPEGDVVAVLGLQVEGGQGRLHSEAIAWVDDADEIRGLFWRRIEAMARSLGLLRLWTTLESPFWKGVGFKKVHEEAPAPLPDDWTSFGGCWLTLPLRSESSDDEITKRLAILRASSQAEHEELMERARWMKWIAMALMLAVFAAFSVWVVSYVRLRKRKKPAGNREW
jgi:N-acetylglutamate synthase-like GNAT family acetyltransferase